MCLYLFAYESFSLLSLTPHWWSWAVSFLRWAFLSHTQVLNKILHTTQERQLQSRQTYLLFSLLPSSITIPNHQLEDIHTPTNGAIHLTMYHTLNMCAQHPPYSLWDCKGGLWLWPCNRSQHLPSPVARGTPAWPPQTGLWTVHGVGSQAGVGRAASRQDGGVHCNDLKGRFCSTTGGLLHYITSQGAHWHWQKNIV